MTLPPIVPGPGEPEPLPPPQIVYVYQQPQQAQQVTKGIWDFMFQWWAILGAIVLFVAVCCIGWLVFVAVVGQTR